MISPVLVCRVDINNVWNYIRCCGVFLREGVQRLLKSFFGRILLR